MNLSVYEEAYLCGGLDRAARVALLSLHAAGSIRVAEPPPHRVDRLYCAVGHPVERTLLDGLPSSGLPVRLVLRMLAESIEVDQCATALVKEKLLHRSLRGLVQPTAAGMEIRERLAAEVGSDEISRFAVLGTPPEALQHVLTEVPPEARFPIRLARRKTKRYDDRGDHSPSLGYAGYVGGGIHGV